LYILPDTDLLDLVFISNYSLLSNMQPMQLFYATIPDKKERRIENPAIRQTAEISRKLRSGILTGD